MPVADALPLVTVAANLGELELLYPVPGAARARTRRAAQDRSAGRCGISAFGGMAPNLPALKSSSASINSALEFITNGP